MEKGAIRDIAPSECFYPGNGIFCFGSGAAGASCAASDRALGSEIDSCGHVETGFEKIYFNRLGFFDKILIDNVGKPFDGKRIIGIFGLIQSQRK
jgi:hypothetical protein